MFKTEPENVTAYSSDEVEFTVEAIGDGSISYQWQESTNNGESYQNISNATGPVYTISSAGSSDNNRMVRCVAQNSVGTQESFPATISVLSASRPDITTVDLWDGVIGRNYDDTLQASGNIAMSWNVSSGSLPPGMSLDEATGRYHGSPSQTGAYTFTITASNSHGSDQRTFFQEIRELPADSLLLWVMGDRGIRLDPSSGKVMEWKDQSGSDCYFFEDAYEYEEQYQPEMVPEIANGRPAIRFNGERTWLNFYADIDKISPTELTVIVVSACRENLSGHRPVVKWMGGEDNGTYLMALQDEVSFDVNSTDNKQSASFNAGSDFAIYSMVYENSSVKIHANGNQVLQGSTDASFYQNKLVGRFGQEFPGDLAEAFIYARALSNSEREQIETYLDNKYISGPTIYIHAPVNKEYDFNMGRISRNDDGLYTLRYSLSGPSSIAVEVYSLNGKMVNRITKNHNRPGSFSLALNADRKKLARGVNIIKLKTENQSITRRLINSR